MYLRETRQRRVDGSYLTHLQIAESVWDPIRRHTKIRILYNCGRADDPEVAERLRRLARSILRRCSPEAIVAEDPRWQLLNAWPYGDVYVLEQLWRRLGMAEWVAEVLGKRQLGFAVERALFAMVANRACVLLRAVVGRGGPHRGHRGIRAASAVSGDGPLGGEQRED